MFKRRGGEAAKTVDPASPTRQTMGAKAEDRALDHLLRHGLQLVSRNYRVARGPHARGGEIDLVMRDRDSTLVFVEVRARADRQHGGAAASVTHAKRQRLAYAAQHYLLQLAQVPPCRFDVVTFDGDQLQWLRAAFDLS